MVTKFGIWEIDKDFGIIGRVKPGYNYKIGKETLWDTRDYKGHIVWDWLIHLTKKTWVNKEIFNDLIIAFVFALDYFKKYEPKNAKHGSIAQSIFIVLQLVDLTQDSEDTDDLSSEKAFKKASDVKLLD